MLFRSIFILLPCPGSKLYEYAGFDSFMLIEMTLKLRTGLSMNYGPMSRFCSHKSSWKGSMMTTTIMMIIKPGTLSTLSIFRLRIKRRCKQWLTKRKNFLFQKSLGTLSSADETSSPTSIPSARGNEDYTSQNRKSTRMVSKVSEMPMDTGSAQRML